MIHKKRIFIIAGEASGDLHAAELIDQVHERDPTISFLGIAGEQVRARGAEILVDASRLAAIGFIELLPHLYDIYAALRLVRRQLRDNPPDLVVLIDLPAFNLRIAKMAKARGIKVLYYISPQIWAWRPKRIQLIKRYVDKMAVIFPFEEAYYQRAHVPVTLVRNALLDRMVSRLTPEEARLKLGLQPKKKTVGLLPGSRKNEIKYLLPLLLATAQQLHQGRDVQFVLPLASTLKRSDMEAYLHRLNFPVLIVEGHIQDVLLSTDVVITASGTATLEVALMQVPMAIVYRLSPLTFFIARRLIKVPYIGLCNILAEEKIVQEFIQDEARVDTLVKEVSRILDDEVYAESIKKRLANVRKKLEPAVDHRYGIADVILEMLKGAVAQ